MWVTGCAICGDENDKVMLQGRCHFVVSPCDMAISCNNGQGQGQDQNRESKEYFKYVFTIIIIETKPWIYTANSNENHKTGTFACLGYCECSQEGFKYCHDLEQRHKLEAPGKYRPSWPRQIITTICPCWVLVMKG